MGSGARYLVGIWAARTFGAGLPFGTALVNLVGSFALVFLIQASEGSGWRPEIRLALGTGAMGGFTTYSTFNLELVRMIERGSWLTAAAYATATVAGCLLFGGLGLVAAKALPR